MMRSVALALILLLPDRLPSLIVLVGFWIPPAVAGWVAAEFLQRSTRPARLIVMGLAIFVLGYAAVWFFFNLGRMPPYIPGSSIDPTFAPPRAVAGLAVVASVWCCLAVLWCARWCIAFVVECLDARLLRTRQPDDSFHRGESDWSGTNDTTYDLEHLTVLYRRGCSGGALVLSRYAGFRNHVSRSDS